MVEDLKLLSPGCAARYLGMPRSTFYKMLSAGNGPRQSRIESRRMFVEADLKAWVASLAEREETAASSQV